MVLKLSKTEIILLAIYALVQMTSLVWRGVNLNYNSPFNDEAIYVVIGRMGFFQGDWQTYTASDWIAGHPYFFPVMAALTYPFKGIVGPRLLNVILGVLFIETVFLGVLLLSEAKPKAKLTGAVLASALAAGAPVLYYVSRLATYDMPGFYFLFLGLILLFLADGQSYLSGRLYFLSVLSLLLGLLTKIIAGIFFPLIVAYSYWRAKKLGPQNYYYWLRYFFAAGCLGAILYFLLAGGSLLHYYQSQSGVDNYNQAQIWQTFWEFTRPFWYCWLLGSLGFLVKKKGVEWLFLTLGAGWVLLFHLATGRWFTLDKHTLASIFFLSLTAGLGIGYLLEVLKSRRASTLVIGSLCLWLVFFAYSSSFESKNFNRFWLDERPVSAYLKSKIQLGDKVLAESGSGPILATYETNFPLNITTFDWFDYASLTGKEAYALAVGNGYFDYIQLVDPETSKIPSTEEIYQVVLENLGENYHLVYHRDQFLVYQRNY